jgi:hypothetical protein
VSANVTFANWLTSSDLDSTCGLSMSIAPDATFAEGSAGDYVHYVPVTLSNPQPNNVTVQYTTTRGTAASNGDYNKAKGILTIPAGQTSGLIAVTIHGDATPEKNESFTVDLTNAVGAPLADASTTITLLNDDLKATMKNASGIEGGSIPFTFTLKFPMATATTVHFCTVANDGASPTQTPVADYTFTDCANGFVTTTIPSQSLTASVAVQTNLDGIKEVGEKFQMRAVVPSTLLLVANGTIKGNKT